MCGNEVVVVEDEDGAKCKDEKSHDTHSENISMKHFINCVNILESHLDSILSLAHIGIYDMTIRRHCCLEEEVFNGSKF